MFFSLSRTAVLFLPLFAIACTHSDHEVGSGPSVATTSGSVVAELGPEGSVIYRDIGYAAAPVDTLRWRAPATLNTPERAFQLLPILSCAHSPRA